jgi:hypothetical protein
MPNTEAAAMVRTVIDESRLGDSQPDPEIRNRVASKLIEAIEQGEASIDDLRKVRSKVLPRPPTMWP